MHSVLAPFYGVLGPRGAKCNGRGEKREWRNKCMWAGIIRRACTYFSSQTFMALPFRHFCFPMPKSDWFKTKWLNECRRELHNCTQQNHFNCHKTEAFTEEGRGECQSSRGTTVCISYLRYDNKNHPLTVSSLEYCCVKLSLRFLDDKSLTACNETPAIRRTGW